MSDKNLLLEIKPRYNVLYVAFLHWVDILLVAFILFALRNTTKYV